MIQSKSSTRASTRQQSRTSIQDTNLDWIKHFSILEPNAEEKLTEIQHRLQSENKEISSAIEDVRNDILDTKQANDKLEEEDKEQLICASFLKQLSKKLETVYLSKKEQKSVPTISKKLVKLKAIVKETVHVPEKKAQHTTEEEEIIAKTKAMSKCSKVHQLRGTVSSFRKDEVENEPDQE